MEKLVNKLGDEIINFSKDNNLNLNETIELLDQISTYSLNSLVCESNDCKPGSKYVLKFEGYLEEYSNKKIAYSLERAANSAGNKSYMNSSDINLVIKDVEKNFTDRVVIKSSELRRWVKDSLDKNGFSFVKEKYAG